MSSGSAFYLDYLPYLLARAAHQVAGQFHETLKHHQLTVLSWRVLAALADERDWTVNELCEVSLAKQPTMSKLLDRLQSRRWIKRQVDEHDARKAKVRITALGRQQIEPAIAQARKFNTSLLADHDQQELKQLKALLRELIRSTESGQAPQAEPKPSAGRPARR
jgi:MarR family transcriptional regulator, organic hydroperoxide resistance regulator